MSEICAISSCKRPSCALCLCCQQKICLPHLKEHQDLLLAEINPLVDQINALGDRLKTFDPNEMIGNARQKLEDWRIECHQQIDFIFEQKSRELNEQVTKKQTSKAKKLVEYNRKQPNLS